MVSVGRGRLDGTEIGSIIWGHVVEPCIETLPRSIKKVDSLAVPSTYQPSANGGDPRHHREFPSGYAAMGKAEFLGGTATTADEQDITSKFL